MIPSSLYNVFSLNAFSVSANQLKGSLPTNIGFTLPHLELLYFGGNKFSGSIPVSFCNASQLQTIDLTQNMF
jgi:Leucine-rich repeat (LRR) protein